MAACTAGEKFSCAPSRTCWSSRALRLVVGVSGVLCGVICTTETDRFTKTGSGQTQGKLKERCVSAGDDVAVERWNHDALLVRKRSFLAINALKMAIILQRQARDKHREDSKTCRLLAADLPSRGHVRQNTFVEPFG